MIPAATEQLRSNKRTRTEVEDFLYYEAQLLDAWRLEEWRDLFTEDGTYLVPSTDNPEGDPVMDLALVDDDREGINGRVQRLMSTYAHIENPRSTTTRLITNVRVWDDDFGDLGAICNVMVTRSRVASSTTYAASAQYLLRPEGDSFRIAHKQAILGHHTLRHVGGVLSIII